MLDPFTVAASLGGVSIGTFALRDVFARVAIKRACEAATADIEKFKKENVYVGKISEESEAVATVMRTTIRKSRQTREAILEAVKKLKIPSAHILLDFPQIEKDMQANKEVFLSALAKSYGHKIEHLYVEQVKYRFEEVKKAAAKKTAEEAAKIAAATAAASEATDTIDTQYEVISEHVAPHLDAFEQEIVDLLDQIGVIDESVEIMQAIQDFMSAHIHDAASDHLGHAAEILSSLHSIPGLYSGLATIKRELEMVTNDQTSLGDAFISGGVPWFLKSLGMKIGISLDAATGGMSMGAFTFLGRSLGKLLGDEVIENENRRLKEQLQRLKDEIAGCHRLVLYAVNEATRNFQEELARRLNECPDINEEDAIKSFMSDLKDAYSEGLRDAEHRLSQSTHEAISQLPENTWLDKVLLIDRRGEVKKLFLEAQREITSRHLGLVHNFSLAAEEHAEYGIDFIIQQVVFKVPETTATLSMIEDVTLQSAADYSASLSAWENETVAFHQEGCAKVGDVIQTEGNHYRAFVSVRKPAMESLANRIAANNARMGKSASPSAA